jgi:hypothetical protein
VPPFTAVLYPSIYEHVLILATAHVSVKKNFSIRFVTCPDEVQILSVALSEPFGCAQGRLREGVNPVLETREVAKN